MLKLIEIHLKRFAHFITVVIIDIIIVVFLLLLLLFFILVIFIFVLYLLQWLFRESFKLYFQ